MKHMCLFVFVIAFLVSLDSAFSLQRFGCWYANQIPQARGAIDADLEFRIKQKRLDKRNVLLSFDRRIYINNMFPVIAQENRQLSDILVDKGFMTRKDLGNIREQRFSYNESAGSEMCCSLESFLRGVAKYLEAFGRNDLVDQIIQVNIGPLAERSVKIYSMVCLNLRNYRVMKDIWALMHTERLWIFDKFFDHGWKICPVQIIVSHYDMCEQCERIVLEKTRQVDGERNYNGKRYKILVGSFSPYYESRSRNAAESDLLKVVLY